MVLVFIIRSSKRRKFMKQKIWAKTLLTTYNCLEAISNAIDKLVITQGVNSGRNSLTTMENAEKIINLIQRKKLMVNLKVITENVMASLDTNSARILVMKYFDHVKPDVCYKLLDMSRRTFFRKANKAVDEFALHLKNLGYDHETLNNMLYKEQWIKEYFNHFSRQEEELDDYEDDAFTGMLSSVDIPKKCRA